MELDEGEVITMPPAGLEHGFDGSNILQLVCGTSGNIASAAFTGMRANSSAVMTVLVLMVVSYGTSEFSRSRD
jgi:hypothetical protein